MMNNFNPRIFISWTVMIMGVILFLACNDDNDDDEYIGNWMKLAYFGGISCSDATCFVINDIAYVGTGYDGANKIKLTNFYAYDPVENSWTRIADFPGAGRYHAVSFTIGNKGYVGTGYDGKTMYADFYSYDPETNTWDTIVDFEGGERYGAVAFAIDNKGYVGCGYDGYYYNDFYSYNPEADTWTKIKQLSGTKRVFASSFVIDGKGYVVCGIDNGSTYVNDFWEYDPSNDTWMEKYKISNATSELFDDDYTGITGAYKASFAIGDKGYLVGGANSSTSSSTGVYVWEYDQSTDLWERKTDFEGNARKGAVGFAIGSRGYVTTGASGSSYYYDLWGFDPQAIYNEYD